MFYRSTIETSEKPGHVDVVFRPLFGEFPSVGHALKDVQSLDTTHCEKCPVRKIAHVFAPHCSRVIAMKLHADIAIKATIPEGRTGECAVVKSSI